MICSVSNTFFHMNPTHCYISTGFGSPITCVCPSNVFRLHQGVLDTCTNCGQWWCDILHQCILVHIQSSNKNSDSPRSSSGHLWTSPLCWVLHHCPSWQPRGLEWSNWQSRNDTNSRCVQLLLLSSCRKLPPPLNSDRLEIFSVTIYIPGSAVDLLCTIVYRLLVIMKMYNVL